MESKYDFYTLSNFTISTISFNLCVSMPRAASTRLQVSSYVLAVQSSDRTTDRPIWVGDEAWAQKQSYFYGKVREHVTSGIFASVTNEIGSRYTFSSLPSTLGIHAIRFTPRSLFLCPRRMYIVSAISLPCSDVCSSPQLIVLRHESSICHCTSKLFRVLRGLMARCVAKRIKLY